jgi:predicted Zn-dependent protease
MRKTGFAVRDFLFSCALIIFCLFSLSCSFPPKLPTVADERLEVMVRNEASKIIEVTTDKDELSRYQIFLAAFPRKDILGVSVGNRRIYISYELAQLAFNSPRYRWLLKQTLAHEIAHEIAGHAKDRRSVSYSLFSFGRGVTSGDIGLPSNVRFHHYSAEKELEADLEGMKYWRELQWDCRIWVRILGQYLQINYTGDIFHPTDERLRQALRGCLPESDPERIAIEKRLAETVRR